MALPALEAPERDRLTALPDDLLHRILGFVGPRLAVGQCSLLSRRWRHLWASMPSVTLDESVSREFGNLLFLLREDAKLHTFCLRSSDDEENDDENNFVYQRRWLRHVMSRGVRVLMITLHSSSYRGLSGWELPDCVFNCATVETIDLSVTSPWELVISPKSVCLPRLKKLRLDYVNLSDSSVVEKLNSGCPALEHLDLARCGLAQSRISSDTLKILSITACAYEEIHIFAPNVVSLRLNVAGRVKLDSMPSLMSAWVNISGDGENHLASDEHDFLNALCNAQHLELLRFDLLLQDMMENPATEGPTFGELNSLYLGEWLITDFYQPFAYFLNRAPNLVSLTLDQWKVCEENNGKVPRLLSTRKEHNYKLNLAPALSTGLEKLRFRISKGGDAGEFSKMRRLLKEKTKPEETEVIWF